MAKKLELSSFLFKPLISKGKDKSIIIIFQCNTESSNFIGDEKSDQTTVNFVFSIWEFSKSFITGYPVLSSVVVQDTGKFLKNYEPLSTDRYDELRLMEASQMIMSNISEVDNHLTNLDRILSLLKRINNVLMSKQEANFVITNENAGLAHIAFKTLTGDVASLKPEEMEKIGAALQSTMASYLDEDLNNSEIFRKLKAELEYKMIDALPSNMRAGAVNLNMVAILDMMKKEQGDQDGKEPEVEI